MPAAAVIPAPLAYIKIVAVKTFEVDRCPARVLQHQVCLQSFQLLGLQGLNTINEQRDTFH